MRKKAIVHVKQVLKCMLLIGFSIQIVLGIIWMCSNFVQVQDFGQPESAFYGIIYSLLGESPQVMFVLQLAAEFAAGWLFMQELWPADRWFALWRCLAFMTYPFAMQTAMAVQPYSFIGSMLLLFLYFCVRKTGRFLVRLSGLVACVLLIFGLSGIVDRADGTRVWDYGWEASRASRMAWSTIINDRKSWPEELQECTKAVWWETTFCADNMVLLLEAVEEQVGEQAAREYYLQMAEVGWRNRAPVIVRQVIWDLLGYSLSPVIVPMQLKGEAYDSYTPGNYSVMRENTPLLTGYYVAYGCWWFTYGLSVAAILSLLQGALYWFRKRRCVFVVAVCILCTGITVVFLTLRGAGMMDYRWTVAVNQLWLIGELLLLRKEGSTD